MAKLVAYPKDILLTDVPSWLSLVPLARSFLTARLLRNFENDGSGKVLFSLSTMLNGAGPFKMIEDGGGPAHAMKEALALPESARGLVQTLGPKQIREAVEALELDFAKDLRGTNLSNIDLTGADLRGFDLERADLRNSTLSHARLEGANLSYADLEGAKVSAVFTDHSTVFQGARFMNAQVEGISRELLKNARLGGAILEGVKIGSARDLMLSATDADMRAIAEKSVADARASTSFIRVMKTEEVESSIGVPSREFPFCYDDADLREVANVMRITALDSITVVDRSEKVVGMIKNSVVAKSIDAKVR